MATMQMTIRQLLQHGLDRRHHATAIYLDAGKLFDKIAVTEWIKKLIDAKKDTQLAERIERASVERLSHTASTFLLGIAIRDHLDLRFKQLPRIIANNNADTFHFFWSIICLCHDLGYEYENKCCDLKLMVTPEGRKKLFNISHDLFLVNETELDRLGIKSGSDERNWILNAILLARKYDSYRRQEKHSDSHKPVIDHGIAGALILYDILYQKYEKLLKNRRDLRRQRIMRNEADVEPTGYLVGVEKEASAVRFIACSLVIACTVARHNMWLAKDDQRDFYMKYGLELLLPENPAAKVSMDLPLDQMLFLLGFMDTVDPVKGIYTRDAELKKVSASELEFRKQFLLDHVKIEFVEATDKSSCPGHFPSYRKFSLYVDGDDREGLFAKHAKCTSNLDQWLKTKKPVFNDGYTKIQYFVPFYPNEENTWPCGITDREVNALLLYEGCGVPGKYGEFYTLSVPYQTFNLLMMPGCTGEQVRVCDEGQTPHGLYLEEWEKTLDVLIDIFTAQCKYAMDRFRSEKKFDECLFRGDRAANFQLMKDCGGTFALTSTSRGGYLANFLAGKKEPHLLEISTEGEIPCFDYSDFFGDDYVFFDEQEVLLAPYIKMDMPKISCKWIEGVGEVRYCRICLRRFDAGTVDTAESYLIANLDKNCRIAAQGLAELVKQRSMEALPKDHPYWEWKKSFQTLYRLRLHGVQEAYWPDKA